MKKVAVIGAGIFGSSSAILLARGGFDVDLYEKEADVLQAASGINQYRLHRGYHYPRSKSTATSSKMAEDSFRREYGEAVVEGKDHHYCIAREHSKVDAAAFKKFCDDCGLEYEVMDLPYINKDSVEIMLKGKEAVLDPIKLKELVKKHLKKAKVNVLCNTEFTNEMMADYDLVVNCTYANLNALLEDTPEEKREYQFELCEKPVLKLPEVFRDQSVVILDGPFTCIDPLSDTGLHVMGNVVHAIHATNNGHYPDVPEEYKPYLNKGIIKNPKISNIDKFIKAATYFMPEVKDAEHIGSMYTVRTVLPRVDHTDERPTLVYPVTERLLNVFSGKIGNSVDAALTVLAYAKAHAKR
jgi:hypothetical protein